MCNMEFQELSIRNRISEDAARSELEAMERDAVRHYLRKITKL